MRRALAGTVLAAMLTGCGTTIVKVEDNAVVSTDATKRLVITNVVKGENQQNRRIVCAEPSPDAIASMVLATAAKANIPQANVNAELSGSYANTVASIGLRTASIQILRDLGYRACEGVMNGVIKDDLYKGIDRVVADATLGLVAIEGLTQMHPAPLVAVSSSGTANTSSNGTNVAATPATINVHDIGKDYKPEEIKNVAASIVEIVRIVAIDAVKTHAEIRHAEEEAASKVAAGTAVNKPGK